MPLTIAELRTLAANKLADQSNIRAVEQREVVTAIIDILEAQTATVHKSKVLTLSNFTTDRNYSVATEIPVGSTITGVFAMLECVAVNNGFAIGDRVTAPTPYPSDNGRTSAQGIGVQFNNANSSTVKVMVNDQLTIMTPYSAVALANANNVLLSGGATANWVIKLFVNYI